MPKLELKKALLFLIFHALIHTLTRFNEFQLIFCAVSFCVHLTAIFDIHESAFHDDITSRKNNLCNGTLKCESGPVGNERKCNENVWLVLI